MPTYAEHASDLLNEAAAFFIKTSENNDAVKPQMMENAATFQKMALLIKDHPIGQIEHLTHGEMAGRLLKDAAIFFRTIADSNPPIADQMNHNADVFDELAERVTEDPKGIPEEEQA